MKTVYIPAGATYNYETLVTDDVIVHGHLHVTNGLKAKHISGRGFITAGEVSADIVDVTELECGTVICRRLLAQRVSVNEAMISESAAVFIKFLCCGKQPLAAAFFCLLAVFAVL